MNSRASLSAAALGTTRYAVLALTSLILVSIGSGQSDGGLYSASLPPSGVQPRRPANYVHYAYPFTPQELLQKYGASMKTKAQKGLEELEKVNTGGPYQDTLSSLGQHRCPEWFKDAKIGMFIDWGPWSVAGYSRVRAGASYPDWYEPNAVNFESRSDVLRYYNNVAMYEALNARQYHMATWGSDIDNNDLINFLKGSRLEPSSIVKLAKASGFRYVVPFLKHHGGYCLWGSSFTQRNSVTWGPGRDFAKEYSSACREYGLKFGIYVSVPEWDYPALQANNAISTFDVRAKANEDVKLADCHFLAGKIPVADYSKDYFVPATKELIDETDPDLIWWDQPSLEISDSSVYGARALNAYFYNKAEHEGKKVCINDRAGLEYVGKKATAKADFSTFEYGSGVSAMGGAWEECRSFSHNFGYNWTEDADADAILSDKACIDMVVDIVGRGGNLLLIVSLTGGGEIPPRQIHALENMGGWLGKFGAAIYDTRAYPLNEQPKWGRITHSKNGGAVYLLITRWPTDGRIEVPSIPIDEIASATVMEGHGIPGFSQPGATGFIVDLSGCTPGDARVSVVALKTKKR